MDEPWNSSTLPTGNVSNGVVCQFEKHEWLLVKFIFISIIGSSVALFGIIGNMAIIAVLTKPSMRTSNNLYLTVLAVFDTLVLIPGLGLYCMEYWNEYFDMSNLYVRWIELVPYCYSLSHFAQTGSVYITVSVTFERYLVVVHPKTATAQCNKRNTVFVIIGVICFAALFNCTKLYEIEVAQNTSCTGFASRELVGSDLFNNEVYSTVYSLWLTHFVMVFFPFGILLAFNTAIAWNFKRSLRQLTYTGMPVEHKHLKEQSRDATRVLVTIVLVFLICNCWGFVTTLMESVYGIGTLRQWAPGLYTFSREVINFLAMVNSSINFVICCVFGEDFRQELFKLCLAGPPGYFPAKHRKSLPSTGPLSMRGKSPISEIARISSAGLRYVDRVSLSEQGSIQETRRGRSASALIGAGKNIAMGLFRLSYPNGESAAFSLVQRDSLLPSDSGFRLENNNYDMSQNTF